MKLDKNKLMLYAVTDRSWLKNETLYEQVEKAIKGGATFIQLREKNLDKAHFIEEAKEIKKLCALYNIPFVINDNVDIAALVDADGVHIGQNDMELLAAKNKLGDNKIIGVSAQTVEQAILAEKNGADYLGVGAVFHTDSKLDADYVSYDTLRAICSAVKIPVIAIGGITKDNILELRGSGIYGVAIISAIFAQPDIENATAKLKQLTQSMLNTKLKTALTIAGSDCSGGAGIQADIKTMLANGVYAMSAITALTAQNTTGVVDIMEVTPKFLEEQIDCIFTDIRPDAVKIGMVATSSLIDTIADKLKEYKAQNIVVDPVMVATSGAKLISDDAIFTLKRRLLPLATVLTPNIPEAELLADIKITNADDMITAAKLISEQYGCAVLCKGGHNINDANDLLYINGEYKWYNAKRINNTNTHGTGCTLSSAIASNLAKGYNLDASVKKAKQYISLALSDMLDLGKGSGPMNHGFAIKGEYEGEEK